MDGGDVQRLCPEAQIAGGRRTRVLAAHHAVSGTVAGIANALDTHNKTAADLVEQDRNKGLGLRPDAPCRETGTPVTIDGKTTPKRRGRTGTEGPSTACSILRQGRSRRIRKEPRVAAWRDPEGVAPPMNRQSPVTRRTPRRRTPAAESRFAQGGRESRSSGGRRRRTGYRGKRRSGAPRSELRSAKAGTGQLTNPERLVVDHWINEGYGFSAAQVPAKAPDKSPAPAPKPSVEDFLNTAAPAPRRRPRPRPSLPAPMVMGTKPAQGCRYKVPPQYWRRRKPTR